MTHSQRQILLIARHYPPNVSGGARRPYLIAQGLRDLGWRVFVASPHAPENEPDWIRIDHHAETRGDELSDSSGKKSFDWKAPIRRAIYWPDNDIRWSRKAAAIAATQCRPEWVLTTSPPESSHVAGRLVKQATGARWLAEFRDNWIEEPLRQELRRSAVRRVIERRIARRNLAFADHIVAASEQIASEMTNYSPSTPATVIGHFAKPATWRFAFDGLGPHLLHTGQFTLSHPERHLGPVLDTFQTARRNLPSSAHLHLAGRLTAEERAVAAQHSAAAALTLHGEVDYETALAMQAGADALILSQPRIDALPGKLGEYLLTGKPILTVGEGPWLDRIDPRRRSELRLFEGCQSSHIKSGSDIYMVEIAKYDHIFKNSIPGSLR